MTATYLVPLRAGSPLSASSELAVYLRETARRMPVIVVDGSARDVFTANGRALGDHVVQLAPDPARRCANGKAWGVRTGLDHAGTEAVVIADDDVRWDAAGLDAALTRLDGHDLVVPQNHFAPLPWHAAWDTGRTLLNRAVAHDWPGTLVLRRSALDPAVLYDGDTLFENCELLRTVRARGGSVAVAADLFVARRPPTTGHFLRQRRRQAYDDLAQPLRMALFLAVIPGLLLARRRGLVAVALAVGVSAAAEVGRRRDGGAAIFPWFTSLCAAPWMLERAVLSWTALAARASGRGIGYGGTRLLRAATPERTLRARAVAGRGQARWRPRKSPTSFQPSTAAATR